MKWLLLILFVFIGSFGSTNCNENRIVHGEKAPDGLYQFLPKLKIGFQMQWDGYGIIQYSWCTSTIISPRHILTNAHCIIGYGLDSFKHPMPIFIDIRPIEYYGDGFYDQNIDISKFGMVQKIYVHRGYHRYLFIYNDVAILEFPEYVKFNITPVKLAKDYVDDYNDTAITAGYATTKKVIHKAPTTLLHLNVGIHLYIPNCLQNVFINYPPFIKPKLYRDNAKNKMCAGNIPMQRFDHGDSGGPLLFEKNNEIYQIGLIDSFFENPEDMMEKLGIYARISSYCPWIEKVTKQEVKCVSLYELPPLVPTPQPSRLIPTTKTPKPQPTSLLQTPKTSTNENPNDAMKLNYFVFGLLFIVAFKLFI